jgi:hypothetical protein
MLSRFNVENVVKAPIKPVPINSFQSSNEWYLINRPSKKQPKRFIVSVPYGIELGNLFAM